MEGRFQQRIDKPYPPLHFARAVVKATACISERRRRQRATRKESTRIRYRTSDGLLQSELNLVRQLSRLLTVNPRLRLLAIKGAHGSRPANTIKAYEIEDWLRGLKRNLGRLNRYKSDFVEGQ